MGKLLIVIILLCSAYASAQPEHRTPLDVVPSVDLSRYAGKWYEIARLPNRYEKRCTSDVTATYTLLENGRLKVVNECRQRNGQISRAEGIAKLANKNGPTSKLRVRFAPAWLSWLPMVWGDYWIIDLAEDHSHAIVGSPDRQYLWLLSRSPQIDEHSYRKLMERISARGFDDARLIRTRQNI